MTEAEAQDNERFNEARAKMKERSSIGGSKADRITYTWNNINVWTGPVPDPVQRWKSDIGEKPKNLNEEKPPCSSCCKQKKKKVSKQLLNNGKE